MKIGTHNGYFHADEVSAVSCLSIMNRQNVEVVRTRDRAQLDLCDIVVDVGMAYDQEKFFDHHQKGRAGERENGIPYSSFGLVWKHFGRKVLSSVYVNNIDQVWQRFDEKVVSIIDALDNGYSLGEYDGIGEHISLISFISKLNVQNEFADEDIQFAQAVSMMSLFINRTLFAMDAFFEDESFVLQSYEEACELNRQYMVLEKGVMWQEHLNRLEKDHKILYVVFPIQSGAGWRCQAVRESLSNFVNRKDLPHEWGGKDWQELSPIIGVEEKVFCHPSHFICGSKTKETILKMTHMALGE